MNTLRERLEGLLVESMKQDDREAGVPDLFWLLPRLEQLVKEAKKSEYTRGFDDGRRTGYHEGRGPRDFTGREIPPNGL